VSHQHLPEFVYLDIFGFQCITIIFLMKAQIVLSLVTENISRLAPESYGINWVERAGIWTILLAPNLELINSSRSHSWSQQEWSFQTIVGLLRMLVVSRLYLCLFCRQSPEVIYQLLYMGMVLYMLKI
jgi:hypothetical protein